ncbi:hypothetical protein BKA66DRAFT_574335 [Pyrenochaeta sp. MPI-SDFR-AT-0127]|nr:hypothetical protein BKA66DRAFT_574335 [Pyrenochaeta sp. MPI-SDFR-AT-0127]
MATLASTTMVDNESDRRPEDNSSPITILADYDLHRSTTRPNDAAGDVLVGGHTLRERQPIDFDPSLAPHPTVTYPVSNPSWWQSTYRRVPDYRPVNKHLDLEERRQNAVFTVVGSFMVFGCMTIASSAWAWRNTLGQLTDIGLHKVGGNW